MESGWCDAKPELALKRHDTEKVTQLRSSFDCDSCFNNDSSLRSDYFSLAKTSWENT